MWRTAVERLLFFCLSYKISFCIFISDINHVLLLVSNSHYDKIKGDAPEKEHPLWFIYITYLQNFTQKSDSFQPFGQALKRLVTVSSMCCHTSTSALSTSYSSRVFTPLKGWDISSWGGFTLRCLQRLSLPDLATGDAIGMTAGTPVSVQPVLSY